MVDLTQKDVLLKYLKEHQLWLNKRQGQHFLLDRSVCDAIVAAAALPTAALVLEIGPGVGTLTQTLVGSLPRGQVIAVERDVRFVGVLEEQFRDMPQVHVRHEDILDFRLDQLTQPYAVVGNIPYQISGAILRKFLDPDTPHQPTQLVLMVQEEVAERWQAEPGSSARGIPTILVELFGEASLIARVPRDQFFPPPKVDSAVIRITRHQTPYPRETIRAVMRLARAGFAAKRRTLANALTGSLRIPKEQIEQLLISAEIDSRLRAEDVTLADWLRLDKIMQSA